MSMRSGRLLSVVIPARNEEQNVAVVAERLAATLPRTGLDYELIFVDDGSCDATWSKIGQLADRHLYIKGVRLSRNWGKDSAILAGLAHSKGDCVAVIDCDLQHPPEVLAKMCLLWRESKADIVAGVKSIRGRESLLNKLCSACFYAVMERLSGLRLKDSSDFRLLDRRVVNLVLDMPEQHLFFRGISTWVGFSVQTVAFEVVDRAKGRSSFTFFNSALYALKNIAAFSSLPMQAVSLMGALYFVLALILGCIALAQWVSGCAVEGFTTVILLLLATGGIIMFSQGVTGYYLSRIYEEVKSRPRFIVDEVTSGARTSTAPIISASKEN